MRSFAAIVIVLVLAAVSAAGGPCSGVRGGCGRSSYRATASLPSYSPPPAKPVSSGCGTVDVRGYTRKDGTHVSAYTRRTPGCAGTSSVRSYRTSARTSYWKGTGSEPDDDERLFAPVPSKPFRYVVHFANGKTRKVAEYKDHRDTFLIGSTNYPRWMIDRIEPIEAEAEETPAEPSPVYIAHFKNGKTKGLIDFYDEDGDWILFGVSGSRGRFLKSMIAYFEPTPDAVGAMRRWADSAGSHHATAKFVSIEGDRVILTKDDGKTVHVPIDKLSESDRDLAKRLQELKGKP